MAKKAVKSKTAKARTQVRGTKPSRAKAPVRKSNKSFGLRARGPSGLAKRAFSQPSLYSQMRTLKMETSGPALTDPMAQHPIVYACVQANSTNIASTKFRIRASEDPAGPPVEGALADLFDDPNPLTSTFSYFYLIVAHLELGGECIVVKEGASDRVADISEVPAELWPLSGEGWTHKVDPETKLIAYWILNEGKPDQIVYRPHEIVHIKYPNPKNAYRGRAPLVSALSTLDMDWKARQYNKSYLDNGGNPSGILSTEESLSPDDREALRAEWESEHGSAAKTRRVAILDKKLAWQSFADSHREMEYTGQLELDRYEILAVFRVPPAEAGFYENVNYSTASIESKRYWTRTLFPKMGLIEDAHWSQMFKYVEGGRCIGLFDRNSIPELQEGLADQLDSMDRLVERGWSVEQAAAKVGLGDMHINPWQRVAWTGDTPKPWGDHYLETMKGSAPEDASGFGGDFDGGYDAGPDAGFEDAEPADAEPAEPAEPADAEPVEVAYREPVTKMATHREYADKYLKASQRALVGVLRRSLLAIRVSALKAASAGTKFDTREEFAPKFYKGLRSKYEALALERARHIAAEAGLIRRAWREGDPRVAVLVKTALSRLDSFFEAVVDAVDSAMAGEPVRRAELVRRVFTSALGATKEVATTEVYALANRVGLLTMADIGVKAHRWSAKDCPAGHASSEEVEVGAPFEDGTLHPHDPAEADQALGCTCLTEPCD